MKKILSIIARTVGIIRKIICHPSKGFRELLDSPDRGYYALTFIIGLGFVGLFEPFVFFLKHTTSWFPSFLKIPDNIYELVVLIFGAPYMLFGLIFATGIVMFFSAFINKDGDILDCFIMVEFGIFIPILICDIHDFTIGLLIAINAITQEQMHASFNNHGVLFYSTFICLAVSFILMNVLLPFGIIQLKKIKGWQAFLIGLVANTVTFAYVFTFVR